MMNWNDVSLENLESLATALTDYLALRRQQAAQSQVVALEQEQRQISLELDEARAEAAAQRELSARLMTALRIGNTGADKPVSVTQDRPASVAQVETLEPPPAGDREADPEESLAWSPELPTPAPGEYFTPAEIAALDFPAPGNLEPDDGGIFDFAAEITAFTPVAGPEPAETPPPPPVINLNGIKGQDDGRW